MKSASINRAPVLTLLAAVDAERLGFTEDESLSLARAEPALTAQRKGRRLGIYKPHEEGVKQAQENEHCQEFWIEMCGRPMPAENTKASMISLSQRGCDPSDCMRIREFFNNCLAIGVVRYKCGQRSPSRQQYECD
jgi:hypothetical protein